MKNSIRCIVACVNSNGEPDLFFIKVLVSKESYNRGQHYVAAQDAASRHGYEPMLTYDENDRAGEAMLSLFVWESASTIEI